MFAIWLIVTLGKIQALGLGPDLPVCPSNDLAGAGKFRVLLFYRLARSLQLLASLSNVAQDNFLLLPPPLQPFSKPVAQTSPAQGTLAFCDATVPGHDKHQLDNPVLTSLHSLAHGLASTQNRLSQFKT